MLLKMNQGKTSFKAKYQKQWWGREKLSMDRKETDKER
jgi:hypothetical protein